jgi:hypothetical protein
LSIRIRKNKRTKFGMFRSESDAKAVCDQQAKQPNFANSKFYTIKIKRGKEGQKPWMAYCLTPLSN